MCCKKMWTGSLLIPFVRFDFFFVFCFVLFCFVLFWFGLFCFVLFVLFSVYCDII